MRRVVIWSALVVVVALVVAHFAAARVVGCFRVPALGDLNAHVLSVLRSYPTDGQHRYHWPKLGEWKGNVRTLRYLDEVLCEGDPEGRCHCSGLTFEVFVQAWQAWRLTIDGHTDPHWLGTPDGVRRLQVQWFGSPTDRTTIRTALVENRLGTCITDLGQARAGDFVQLWRNDGSGHCAVFLAWERDGAGARTGIHYWSTQASTNGIGERSEFFGAEGHAVKRDEFYVCRAGTPPASR